MVRQKPRNPGRPLNARHSPATGGRKNAEDAVRPRTQKTEASRRTCSLGANTARNFRENGSNMSGAVRRRRRRPILLLVDPQRQTTGRRRRPGDNDAAARLTAMTGRGGVPRLNTRRAGRLFAHEQLQYDSVNVYNLYLLREYPFRVRVMLFLLKP